MKTEEKKILEKSYEELRLKALDRKSINGRGTGFVLFLRRGMVAWMKAWQRLPAMKKESQNQTGDKELLLKYQQSEVVILLAGMILGCRKELRR